MNSLIVDYLTTYHYHYTLSVFQPEAGLSGLHPLNHKDMLQLMHIGAGSPLQAALSKKGGSTEGKSLDSLAILLQFARSCTQCCMHVTWILHGMCTAKDLPLVRTPIQA